MMLPDRLHWSVWALSRPASEQIELFPLGVPAAEELALEFEEHYESSAAEHGKCWNQAQVSSLKDLDERLSQMSGQEHLDLWLSADSLSRSEWASVRALADRVLVAFELQHAVPNRSPAIYITE
jgi:hypothetical protein